MAKEISQRLLGRMTSKELASKGYIRIPGFTKKNGDKVKSHIRKLSRSRANNQDFTRLMNIREEKRGFELELSLNDKVLNATQDVVEFIYPVERMKSAVDSVNKGDYKQLAIDVAVLSAEFIPLIKIGKISAKIIKRYSKDLKSLYNKVKGASGSGAKQAKENLVEVQRKLKELTSTGARNSPNVGAKIKPRPRVKTGLSRKAEEIVSDTGDKLRSGKMTTGEAVKSLNNKKSNLARQIAQREGKISRKEGWSKMSIADRNSILLKAQRLVNREIRKYNKGQLPANKLTELRGK